MDGRHHAKVKQNGKYINKCIYIVIGLKNDDLKEVLGMWLIETESAAFWLFVLTDLKARGVEDILITCRDILMALSIPSGTYSPKQHPGMRSTTDPEQLLICHVQRSERIYC